MWTQMGRGYFLPNPVICEWPISTYSRHDRVSTYFGLKKVVVSFRPVSHLTAFVDLWAMCQLSAFVVDHPTESETEIDSRQRTSSESGFDTSLNTEK